MQYPILICFLFYSHKEMLTCRLYCPVKRPDFIICSQKKEIVPFLEFPLTVVGLKKKLLVEINNITWHKIYLRTTTISVDDTFYLSFLQSQNV